MKVWVVTRICDYDLAEVLGVRASVEKAKAFAEEYVKRRWDIRPLQWQLQWEPTEICWELRPVTSCGGELTPYRVTEWSVQ